MIFYSLNILVWLFYLQDKLNQLTHMLFHCLIHTKKVIRFNTFHIILSLVVMKVTKQRIMHHYFIKSIYGNSTLRSNVRGNRKYYFLVTRNIRSIYVYFSWWSNLQGNRKYCFLVTRNTRRHTFKTLTLSDWSPLCPCSFESI